MKTLLIAVALCISMPVNAAWFGLVETKPSFYTPEGKPAYDITCRRKQANCMKEMSKICKGPYTIVSADDQSNTMLMNTHTSMPVAIKVRKYSMVASCDSDPAR